MPRGRSNGPVDELPIALTVSEVAELLQASRSTVYELIHRGQATGGADGLRAIKLGRGLRVPRSAFLEFLGSCGGSRAGERRPSPGGDRGAA